MANSNKFNVHYQHQRAHLSDANTELNNFMAKTLCDIKETAAQEVIQEHLEEEQKLQNADGVDPEAKPAAATSQPESRAKQKKGKGQLETIKGSTAVAGRLFRDARDPDLSMYDDLRYQTMAQHKAIVQGDVLKYELLENHMLTRAAYKGLALSSASIELVEHIMEKEKTRRPTARVNRDYSEELDGDPALVNNQESHSDIRGSKFYWEEVEPGLKGAGYILDSSVPPT